ncbi:MAG: Beta-glucanase/Beta-glucan synthetase [Parcubacteria group bacterium]|nr:Beta-glucanase/Beta-glucan synthetase [Parcubacteria group bacterium]
MNLRKLPLLVGILLFTLAPFTTHAALLVSDLAPGIQNAEVSDLQNALAKMGYFNALERGYFGSQTQTALRSFQTTAGLPVTGLPDALTRNAINSFSQFNSASPTASGIHAGATSSTGDVLGASTERVNANLSIGTSGDQVRILQEWLKRLGYFQETATGYYGTLTSAAVSRFQQAYGIPVVGTVGPITRERLNALVSTGTTVVSTPTLTLTASKTPVQSKDSVEISWTATNASSCRASGAWSGSKRVSGSDTQKNLTSGKTYKLTCSGTSGSVEKSVTVDVARVSSANAPSVSFSVSPSEVSQGGTTTITWSSKDATSCTATDTSLWNAGNLTAGKVTVSNLQTSRSFGVTCSGAGGSVTKSDSVTVRSVSTSSTGDTGTVVTSTPAPAHTTPTTSDPVPTHTTTTIPTPTTPTHGTTAPDPTVSFSANRTSVSYNDSVTLTWSSTNATSCTASGAGWSTSQPTAGTVTVPRMTASQTYTLTCSGAGGNSSKSIAITVGAAPVTTTPSTPTTPPPSTTPPPTPTPSTTGLPVLLKASGGLTGPQNGVASITYNWTGVPMAADYYMFVHVLDANGGILFQNDSPIPSRTWSGPYSMTNSVKVPAGIPVGKYSLRAGIFSLASGYPKMPVTPGPGVTKTGGEEAYIIGTLTVTAGTNLPYSPPNDPSAYPGMPVQTSIPNAGDPITGNFNDDFHPAGMNLKFHDEFNGTKLNTNTWNEMYLWGDRFLSGNSEKECYLEENVRVAGGNLIFDAKKQDVICPKYNIVQPYTSGMVTTSKSFVQSYGYWAIRTKLPRGQGFWPAFWLLPNNAGWPPELDIFEVLDQDPTTLYNSIHTSSPTNPNIGLTLTAKVADLSTSYHVIAADWEPTYIIFYLDGVEVNRINQVFNSIPMYLVANLGVGGSWGGNPDSTTPFPSTMDTDWIRVYK